MCTEESVISPLRIRLGGPEGSIECCLYGGTAEQVRLLLQPAEGTPAPLDQALAGFDDGRQRLLRAIAYPQPSGRVLASQQLLQELWRADGGLGPYPLLGVLASFQTGHAYYPAYRDHLVHQLRVWLLGRYLLQRMPCLLAALVAEIRAEADWAGCDDAALQAEAMRRWLITACWHDLGYVFEVQSAEVPQELIERTFAALNATFATPLAHLGVVTAEQERFWQQEVAEEQPLPPWTPLVSFDALVAGRYQQLWQVLAPAGCRAGLSGRDGDGGLLPYLQVCRIGELAPAAGPRPGFIDHGIAGALLLLRLHRFFGRYCQQVVQLLQDGLVRAAGDEQEAITGLAGRVTSSASTVEAAARAIALHNVLPGLPLAATATTHGLTPHRFRLHLEGDKAQPLAFLLALADGLQGWDRPRFTAPRALEDIGLIDQQVLLSANEQRIFLRFIGDEPTAGKRFLDWRQELGRLAGIGELLVNETGSPAPPLPFETAAAVPDSGDWDLRPYLAAVLHECGTLELKGIMPSGKARGVVQVPIQELYAPLRVAGGVGDLWQLLADPTRCHGLTEEAAGSGDGPRVLLLVGDPGSGKSTFLRMTAAVLARALGGEPWAREHPATRALSGSSDTLPIPVLIRLSELTRFIGAERFTTERAVDAPTLIREYLAHWAEHRQTGIPAAVAEGWLQQGRAVLLLDGLDEIPNRSLRRQVGKIIANAVADRIYGACRFCLTSRPLRDEAYPPLLLPRTIEGLGDEAIERFLDRWASLVARGAGDGRDGEAYGADLLAQARRAGPAIRAMLRNPLMLTCLAVIHWNERRLPEQRAELLEAIVTWLLRAREDDERDADMGEHRRRRIFQALARAMHCHPGGRVREVALPEAAQAIAPYCDGASDELRQLAASRFLEVETVRSGIVTPRGDDHLQLWHLSFQELLVADLLAASTDDSWPELLTGQRLFHPEWREVVLLLAGRLGNSPRAQALLRLILESAGNTLAGKAQAYGLAMAAVNDLRPYQLVPDPGLGLDQLGREVLRIFTTEGATVPLKARVEAGEALGRTGDPRLLQENWVEIEPGLSFGTYPVTVQEYQWFVDSGGYDPEGFGASWLETWQAAVEEMLQLERYKGYPWLQDDRSRRTPGDWEEQLATPNRPVVGVSWYEAAAYCRWLTLQGSGTETFRLPSEDEWQRAAVGKKGGRYPWGDADPGKGDNARANYDKAGTDAPSPVGLFPSGAADWGDAGRLHDMAGNVWEWCNDTLSERGHKVSTREQPDLGGSFRPLRGGAYWVNADHLEVSNRAWHHAASWDVNIGFRVVRCSSCARPPLPVGS